MDPNPSLRWQEAEQLTAQGDEVRARPLYLALTEDRALAPYAHLRLGVFAQRDGDPRGAAAHALAAFRSAHGDPELLELVAKSLLRAGLVREALACADAMLRLGAPINALAEVGKMLSDHMQPEAALPLLRRAMAQGLAGAPAMQYLVGLNLMYLGRDDDARAALEVSLRGNPDLAPAHWARAKLGGSEARGARIGRLRAALARAPQGAPDAPLLGYALFHELDREGDAAAAWPVLEEALRRRRAQVRHDEREDEALFDAAQRTLDLPEAEPDAAETGPQPVFVVGMPRTGTTLIEQQLCARADAASAGELRDLALQLRQVTGLAGPAHLDARQLDALTPGQVSALGQRYLEHSRWRAGGQPHYLDKWPENYLGIGLILAALPQARVVWVRRDPVDACFSNLKEWFAASYFYSYDQGEVARRCARFERLRAAVQARASERVAWVDYETFVRQPEAEVERLLDRLALPRRSASSPALTGAIATASTRQVREGVSARHVGAWRRYAEPLAPLRAELARLGLGCADGGAA